jgi:bacterioferritin
MRGPTDSSPDRAPDAHGTNGRAPHDHDAAAAAAGIATAAGEAAGPERESQDREAALPPTGTPTRDWGPSLSQEARGSGADSMPFLTDVRTLRERARRNIEEGALTRSYQGDAQTVVRVLNDALATEIVCTLRYRRHYFMAKGLHAEAVKAEFLEHANEEQEHADRIAERIVQLGGEPDFDPQGLASRSHAEYVPGTSLLDMIKEDLVAERIAIDSYREIVQWVAPFDPVTRALMEEILAKEEEHADELSDLLVSSSG